MSRYTQLKAQLAKLQAQADEVRRQEIAEIVVSIR
ncbi:hypothetical protein AK36_5621 [Burkholderia vietnamiensis LMG 10929]|nr:hypothetical protein AK36_5621 [Burkholderia vietnamiensis LMG 10929]